ncbi:hypothetical protein [Halovivax sp.]|uniref:hypothetical protein n=1 Tax=Halovivax sp. TaxID=1935978 RepID=UPI0025BF5384|nr:hypothetical protein [Halovivax sp.]
MHDCTRRRLLAATGAVVGTGALAGCLGDSEDDEEPDDESGDDAEEATASADDDTDDGNDDGFNGVEGTVLGDITVDNLHEENHEIDVQVEIDGSTEAWRTVELEARKGGVELEREWSSDGGNFRVRVRLDGEQFVEVTPGDWNDPDCISLLVIIGHGGDLRIAGDTTGGYCAS